VPVCLHGNLCITFILADLLHLATKAGCHWLNVTSHRQQATGFGAAVCRHARQALRTCKRNCNKIHLLAGPVCKDRDSLRQVLQR